MLYFRNMQQNSNKSHRKNFYCGIHRGLPIADVRFETVIEKCENCMGIANATAP